MPESKTPIGRESMRRFYERLRWADEGAASGRVLRCSSLAPAGNAAYTKTDQFVTMDDGVGIATTLYLPDTPGPRPRRSCSSTGSGATDSRSTRSRSRLRGPRLHRSDVRLPRPRAVGAGSSPRSARASSSTSRGCASSWLPTHAPVDGDKVGAWGISLGGGAALRAAGEGTPFKALEVVETWTDLYEALVPQGLPKSGAIFQFLGAVPRDRQGARAPRRAERRREQRPARAARVLGARSSRQSLSRGYPPTMFFQGRQDFAFGLEQGVAGWQRHSRAEGALCRPVRTRTVEVPRARTSSS